jgi:carboxymethylenebutenolidase
MKKITVLFMLTFAMFLAKAQDDVAICHTPATEKFAMFASNKSFNAAHPTPRVYTHISQEGGKMITFKCADGVDANAYLLTAKKKTNNWIFVFQEWWGLNDNIKRQAEDLFKDLGNVNVLALDMYDGKVATDRENAGKYMQEFKQDRGNAIVKGAIAYVGKDAKIGTVGFCFGGGQSMQAALTSAKQAVACVIYYGMPEEDVTKLKTLNCDVLMIWATKDQWINKDMMDKFEANMKSADKKLTIKPYDAGHGFANPSNPMGSYDETAYKDSYKNTLEFFKGRLK